MKKYTSLIIALIGSAIIGGTLTIIDLSLLPLAVILGFIWGWFCGTKLSFLDK